MKQFKNFVKIVKILIMVGWFFSAMLMTMGLTFNYSGVEMNDSGQSMIGLLTVIFGGAFTLMTPFFFYAIFGKVWMNGIESLEKERQKMIEESDKYTESTKNINRWLEIQMKKDLEKGN
ncbi:MAG: hypothetical protein ACOC3V_00770 [bacterium]